MMAIGLEEDEVKEWKLIKDYTVPEGEIVSTIKTPTEEEMEGISELFIVAETLAIKRDGSSVSNTSLARPTLTKYNDTSYSYGRLSVDMVNSIGSTDSSRRLVINVTLIGGILFGYADNINYSINALVGIKHKGVFERMPQIEIRNNNGYSYISGTNIKVFGR